MASGSSQDSPVPAGKSPPRARWAKKGGCRKILQCGFRESNSRVERGGGHCDRARGNGHAASEILFSLWAGDIYTSPGRFVTSPALTSLPVAPRSPVNPPVSR